MQLQKPAEADRSLKSNTGGDLRVRDTFVLIERAGAALRKARVLELQYEGFVRALEVHAVGWTKEGHPVLRAWQVGGGRRRGERAGWKFMRLDEAVGAEVCDTASRAPRRGY